MAHPSTLGKRVPSNTVNWDLSFPSAPKLALKPQTHSYMCCLHATSQQHLPAEHPSKRPRLLYKDLWLYETNMYFLKSYLKQIKFQLRAPVQPCSTKAGRMGFVVAQPRPGGHPVRRSSQSRALPGQPFWPAQIPLPAPLCHSPAVGICQQELLLLCHKWEAVRWDGVPSTCENRGRLPQASWCVASWLPLKW